MIIYPYFVLLPILRIADMQSGPVWTSRFVCDDISSCCVTRLELIVIRHSSIFISVCLPSTSQNISLLPVFSWHYFLITLHPRGLCNSFALLATLKIFDWYWSQSLGIQHTVLSVAILEMVIILDPCATWRCLSSRTTHHLAPSNPGWYWTSTLGCSVIFVNENENENGEKRENNEFVNEN